MKTNQPKLGGAYNQFAKEPKTTQPDRSTARISIKAGSQHFYIAYSDGSHLAVTYEDTVETRDRLAQIEKAVNSYDALKAVAESLKFAVKVMERDLSCLKSVLNEKQAGAYGIANDIVRDYLHSPNGNPIEHARKALAALDAVEKGE